MQNRPLILTILLVAALALSACASGNNQSGEPVGTIFPTEDGTVIVPNTGQTAAPTLEDAGGLTVTPIASETATATEMATATTAATAPPQATATGEATEAGMTTATPLATEAGTPGVTGTPAAAGQPAPGAAESIIGIPETGRSGLAGLAALVGFRVEDTAGNAIGTARDFVLNTCEANILYIVVDPAEGAGNGGGQQVLVPYQATLETPNNGQVNLTDRAFVIDMEGLDAANIPGVDAASLDMQNPDWETETLAYWSGQMELSLTSECSVPGSDTGANDAGQSGAGQAATGTPTVEALATELATPTSDRVTVRQVALASQMLQANLQDGNGMLLGTLRDAAIVPETGHVQYLLVDLGGTGRIIPLPMGAVRVNYEASASQPVFVLLVDAAVLQIAPDYDLSANTINQGWFEFWNQLIPMTLDQLP